MKKVALVLFLVLAQDLESQQFLTTGGIGESNDRFIVSNLINAHPHDGRYVGGPHPKRAVSLFTADNRYGVEYRVDYIVTHYNEWNPGYENDWREYRWGSTRIYSNRETGSSRPDKRIGRFNNYEKRRWQDAPYDNPDIVRQDARIDERLKPHTTYWVVFDTSYSGDYKPGADHAAFNKFFTAENVNEYSSVGWTIGDRMMTIQSAREDIGNWAWPSNPETPPFQFALKVREYLPDPWEIGDTITPGNLAEKNFIRPLWNIGQIRQEFINNSTWLAQNFYTSTVPDSPPVNFRINHVTMHTRIRNLNSYVSGTHILAIYDSKRDPDNWWRRFPGKEIGRFASGPPEIIEGHFPGRIVDIGTAPDDEPEQHRFHADPNAPIILEPFKRYWLVHRMQNASGNWPVTSFTRVKNQEGWPIGDFYWRTTNSGSSWTEIKSSEISHLSIDNDKGFRFGFDVTIIDPPAPGDINVDGSINVLDLILINDHLRGAHHLQGVLFDLGNINSDGGSQYITNSDRDLLLNLILEK